MQDLIEAVSVDIAVTPMCTQNNEATAARNAIYQMDNWPLN